MTKDDPKPEDRALTDEFLVHVLMRETADYVQRGRRFLSLPLSELNERWIAAFRDVIINNLRERIIDMDDLAAELRLRELDPPYDRVAEERAKMVAELYKLGPDSATPNMMNAIDEFLIARSKPKN
jgi:hypothetical protein